MPIALLVASSKSKIPNEPKINSYGKLKPKKSYSRLLSQVLGTESRVISLVHTPDIRAFDPIREFRSVTRVSILYKRFHPFQDFHSVQDLPIDISCHSRKPVSKEKKKRPWDLAWPTRKRIFDILSHPIPSKNLQKPRKT